MSDNSIISVASGADETDLADAITAAFASTVAPFSVDNVAGVVTVTATDLGTIGNAMGIEVSNLAAGTISVTIAAGVTGATPPTVTDVMDLVGNTRYQGILWPNDLLASLDEVTTDFLDDRFNASNEILDGVAFMGYANTLAATKTFVNGATPINTQSLVLIE